MKVQTWERLSRLSWLAPVFVGLLLSQGNMWGQESAPEAPPAAKKETKERAKPRGRLPAYYSEVVSREQKEQIYDIQQKFLEQIQKLQSELQKLEEDRDAEVAAVLTAEQKERVAQLMAARSKRKGGDAADKGRDGSP